jgi:hypothetical protein
MLGADPTDQERATIWGAVILPIKKMTRSKDGRPRSLSMANSQLRCDWHLEQTAAMIPPSVVIKDGMGGRRLARSFSRGAATERLVNAIFVVIISELFQLSPQVDCVPD